MESFRINNLTLEYVWRCYHQSPLLHMCRHLISSQLLNNGIKFCYGKCTDRNVEMKAERELLIEEKWVPFCTDLVDSILCFGYAVVHINDYPSVLKLGTYWLKAEISPQGYDWKVYNRGSVDEEMPNTYVFSIYDPLTDGTLTSPIYKIIPRLLFLKKLRECAATMEQSRANPIVYSEIKEGQNVAEKEGVDFDFYADAGASENNREFKYSRNKTAVSLLNQQKDLYDTFLGKRHAEVATKTLNHVIPLPMGHSLKLPSSETGRLDLANIHKIIQEEVCATLGVPRSMIISDTGMHQGADKESIHETFMHSLMWWKKKLGAILSDVYNMIYIDELKKKIDFNKESDPYKAKQMHSVNVYFPVTPFVSNENLRTLYEQGVISWHTYAKYALMNVSLPLDDMQSKPPPIDKHLFEEPKEPPTKKLKV